MTLPQILFLVVIALAALQRLVEVVVSRSRLRAGRGSPVPEPVLFPAMVVLHLGFLTMPPLEVFLLERPFVPGLAAAAGVVLAAAILLRVWTLWTLGSAWNVLVVVPDEAAVVTRGPYAWVRHPNYLVVILEIVALPLLHTAWISAVALSLINALVLTARIRTEEAALERLPAWREAMGARSRLIPGVF